MATTNDAVLAELLRSLANHGRDGIYVSIDQELGNHEVIEGRFRFQRPGYSYRLTEMEAAIGCAEFETWQTNGDARRRNGDYLIQQLSDLPLKFPKVVDAVWMFLPIVCGSEGERASLVQRLEKDGIETRYFLPLTDQPVYRSIVNEDDFPFAAKVNREGAYVGIHPALTDGDLSRIETAFHDFF